MCAPTRVDAAARVLQMVEWGGTAQEFTRACGRDGVFTVEMKFMAVW